MCKNREAAKLRGFLSGEKSDRGTWFMGIIPSFPAENRGGLDLWSSRVTSRVKANRRESLRGFAGTK